MARIPTNLPTVDMQATGLGRYGAQSVTPMQNATGDQLEQAGRAASSLGQGLARIGEQLSDAYDEARATEADALFGDVIREQWEGEKGYRWRVGKEAAESHREVVDAIEKKRRELEGSLTNELQRTMFRRSAQARAERAMSAIGEHRQREILRFSEAESVARIKGLAEDAATFGKDGPDQAFRDGLVNEARKLAATRGYGPEQTKELLTDSLTDMHASFLGGLLAKQMPDLAAQYVEQHAGEMRPSVANGFREQVQRHAIADRSTKLSMELMQTAEMAAQAEAVDISPVQKLEWMQRQLDDRFQRGEITAAVRDATLTRLDREWAQRRENVAAEQLDLLNKGEKWLFENPGKTLLDWSEYTKASERGILPQLLSFQSSRRQFNDPQVEESLMQMEDEQLAQMSPQEFSAAFAGSLSPNRMDYWRRRVAKARGEASPEDLGFLSQRERVKWLWREFKNIKPDAVLSTQQNQEFAAWEKEFNDRLVNWQRGKNKGKLTDQDVIDYIKFEREENLVLLETGMMFKDIEQRPLSALTPEEQAQAFVVLDKIGKVRVRDFTNEEQARATVKLVQMGKDATTANVLAMAWQERELERKSKADQDAAKTRELWDLHKQAMQTLTEKETRK